MFPYIFLELQVDKFCNFQVMVMTADILGMLLLNNFISLSNLALIILDECHHAVDDHPMRQASKRINWVEKYCCSLST